MARLVAEIGLCFVFLLAPSFSGASNDFAQAQWALDDPWGDEITFSQQQTEHPTLLFFWASWCPYCHKLMPGIQRTYTAYEKQPVTMLSINVWETGDAMAYMFDHDYNFPVLVDGEVVADFYGIKGTPGVLVLDSNGKVLYHRIVGDSPKDVEAAVNQALQQALERKSKTDASHPSN